MHTSQLTICTQCASISSLYKQVECSIYHLTLNNWTNQSYGTKLFYDISLLEDLLRYKQILGKKMVNTNYLNISTSIIASLLVIRMYKQTGCPDCNCEDFTDFITSSSTSTLPSSTTTTLPVSSTSTTLPVSSTTTTLPSPIVNPIACANVVTFTGGQTFPSAYEITLGSGLGNVILNYNTFNIPDKIIVYFDGVPVIDTGYRGDSSYQSQLTANLALRGVPNEIIQGTGIGTASFNKTTATTKAYVYVYGPLTGTGWNFTLNCPV